MNLRRRFRFLLGTQVAMAIGLAILATALFRNQEALSRAQKVHFQSYLLADELRRSSDDLTRLAREFVATGNEEFEREYGAVLEIRNGKMPRPLDYNRVYWDLVTNKRPKPRPDGATIPLHELMVREGFTNAELGKLSSAQRYSDTLVKTERTAMNAAKGLFDDGTGNVTVKRAPDRALAMTMMNDEAYQANKASVMQPIDDFYVMFGERTADDVAKFGRRSLALLSAMGTNIAAILGLSVFSFVSLRRQLSERERAETALRESEARLRILGDNLPNGMIYQLDMGTDGTERQFTYVSAGVEKLHEVTAASVLVDAHILYRQIVPEDRLVVAALEAKALASMKPFLAEMRSLLPSGHVRWNLVSSAPRRAANRRIFWDGVELDITERKRAETDLRESEERYRLLNVDLEQRVALRTGELAARNHEIQALLDSIPDIVLLCDQNGAVISSHSPSVQPESNLLSKEPTNHDHGAIYQEIAFSIHALVQSGNETIIQEFDRVLNGATVSIEARATRVGLDRVFVLMRDITARRRMERDVLNNLKRERQLSETKSQFITVASHEFRTPLAVAVGSVELLERHAARLTDVKRGELFARIQRALARLTSIMNDMLMLNRADSGRMKVARMEVDLGGFVQDVVRRAEATDQQQHTFSFRQAGGPSIVPADTNLLHRILSNLIENAVRYSPVGTNISVVLEISGTEFSLAVADEGIGIPEPERERIFEPFVRGSNIGQIGGTGLGLTLAKRYAELMGSRIELLAMERCTTFRIRVPLIQPPTV